MLAKQCHIRFIFVFFQCILAGQQFFDICEFLILCSNRFFELFVQLQFQKFPDFFVMQLQFFRGINSAQVFCGRVWLSDRLCTHVTFYAFEQQCRFQIPVRTDDRMGVQMETRLGSSRRYVPEGILLGMEAGG